MTIHVPRYAYPREARDARRAFSRCYLAVAVFMAVAHLIISVISIAVAILFGEGGVLELTTNVYFVYALQVVVLYMMAFPVFLLLVSGMPRVTYKKRRMGFGKFTAAFFIACFVMTLGISVSSFISLFLPASSEGSLDVFVNDAPLWLVIAVVVIIGPIVEELVFRKILIDRLSVYGDRLAVFVSATMFGFFHGNHEQIFYAIMLGIVFGYVYTSTRSIKHSILLHVLVNFIGTVPAILASSALSEISAIPEGVVVDGGLAIRYLLYLGLLLLTRYGFAVVGMIILLYLIFAEKIVFSPRCRIRLRGGDVIRCTVLNFGAVIFFLYYGSEIALYAFPSLLSF